MNRSSYITLTALGFRQEVEQIRLNVIYLKFLNVFLLKNICYALNSFNVFWNVFVFFASIVLMYVCPSCADDTATVSSSTPTTSVSCSPRWIVYPNTYSLRARLFRAATTQNQCLDACVADSSCDAVEWRQVGTRWRCYMHDIELPRQQNDAATLFEIVRRCYAESNE